MFTIALDISIDDKLLAEGVSREFINKIQNERKENKLEVTDKIEIYIDNSSKEIISFLLKHKGFICNETQALELYIDNNIDDSKLMDIDIASLKVESTVINYKIKSYIVMKSKYIILIIGLIFLDQLVKYIVHSNMPLHTEISIIGDFIKLYHIENQVWLLALILILNILNYSLII